MPDDRPIALVTGVGRRRGIGAAVALRLAADGWDVACSGWQPYDERMPWGADPETTSQLTAELTALGARSAFVAADLEDPDQPRQLFDEVEQQLGQPPVALVPCHAESVDSGLLDTSVESFDRHYAVNVRASWLLVRELATRATTPDPRGRVVALTSDHTVGNLPYGATKGALDRLVLAASVELAQLRITANVVDPGPTDTGWMSQQLEDELAARTPLGRVGRPEDAAQLVAFLCSEAGGWVNGQLICSDGGFSRQGLS